MAQTKQLELVSKTELYSRAPDGFPVGCPTLDVVTTWDSDSRNLLIYRPPGQVISKIHQIGPSSGAPPEAVAVTWKPDGQFLAVGWSDGVVRLMGLENNKAAHHLPVFEQTETKVTYIGWASCNISPKSALARLKDSVAESWARQGPDLPVNLPQELTFLDIDTALPRISPLPTGSAGPGEDAIVFTLRTGIDFLFQSPERQEYDNVNVMAVGTSDGKLQLSIHDSFVIGTFQCPTVGVSATSQLVYHASHPAVSTHALVLADSVAQPEDLHLVPMDLLFIHSSPINLSFLASKLITLQKLLRYLRQTQFHMHVEWKNTRELPSRLLRNVQNDLEEMQKSPRGIVPALYHAVVTGHAHEPVREWLVSSLAERGHKLWDKAVVSGLENLRSLVHENFLPALDRCSIILSRLRGLAQFYDDRDDVGFSVTQVNRVLDIISCLNLAGHKILIHAMDELEHFKAFSSWLRFAINRLASNTEEELTEKEATMDNARVLAYIERYLTGSPLDIFFDDISNDDFSADWDYCEDGPNLLEMLDKQLQKRENGQAAMKAILHVHFLTSYLTSWCNRIFKSIAESQRRSVKFGRPVRLSMGSPVDKLDVRVRQTAKGAIVYAALASSTAGGKVHLICAEMDIVNGVSTNLPTTRCCVDLGHRQLIDFKFLGDTNLILLCSEPDETPIVISVPVQASELPYAPSDAEKPNEVRNVPARSFPAYTMPKQQAWRPVQIEVHGRSDVKGELPQRICILDSHRMTWSTFAMPYQENH